MKKTRLIWFFAVIFSLVLFGCKNSKTNDNPPVKTTYEKRNSSNFQLVHQDTTPSFKGLRRLRQHIWLKTDLDTTQLKSFLNEQYHWVKDQRIFMDGKIPNDIFIAVYGTQQKAEKGYSDWVAAFRKDGSKPQKITIQKSREEKEKSIVTKFEMPDYEIIDDRTNDMNKVKVMVNQDIWVKNHINRKSLRKLLNKQYSEISERSGYKYFKHPTQIFIYVFDSREKAQNSGYNWVAMVQTEIDGEGKNILFADEVK